MRTYKTVRFRDWRVPLEGIGHFIKHQRLLRFHGIGSRKVSVRSRTIQQKWHLENCYWNILLLGCRVRADMQTCSTNSINHQASPGPSIRSWLLALPGVGRPLSNPESITERSTNMTCDPHTCGLVLSGCRIHGRIVDHCVLERVARAYTVSSWSNLTRWRLSHLTRQASV